MNTLEKGFVSKLALKSVDCWLGLAALPSHTQSHTSLWYVHIHTQFLVSFYTLLVTSLPPSKALFLHVLHVIKYGSGLFLSVRQTLNVRWYHRYYTTLLVLIKLRSTVRLWALCSHDCKNNPIGFMTVVIMQVYMWYIRHPWFNFNYSSRDYAFRIDWPIGRLDHLWRTACGRTQFWSYNFPERSW